MLNSVVVYCNEQDIIFVGMSYNGYYYEKMCSNVVNIKNNIISLFRR